MLAVQWPLSLPSAPKLSVETMQGPLPPLPQLRDFDQHQESERRRPTRREEGYTPFEARAGNVANIRHGLRTPPSDMNEMNVNPLLVPDFGPSHYKGVPIIPSDIATHKSNLNGTSSLRYTNRAPPLLDTYQPAKASQSPYSATGQPANREQPHQRRKSDGTDIVHYLQIPRSINDSKGSLSEFAAQVKIPFLGKLMRKCLQLFRSPVSSGLSHQLLSSRWKNPGLQLLLQSHSFLRPYRQVGFVNGSRPFCRLHRSHRM